MSKKKKVLCPYCGERMEFQDGPLGFAWLKCPKCKSCAPLVKGETPEQRRAEAFVSARNGHYMKQNKKQKPLTLNELLRVPAFSWVWVEIINSDVLSPDVYPIAMNGYFQKIKNDAETEVFTWGSTELYFAYPYGEYKKSWIAFRHEPTQRELEAAGLKWEDKP